MTDKNIDARLYQPLSGGWHIRVLSLSSDTFRESEILCCTLTERNLDSFVPWAGYCALSYVWGASPERIEIICNNRPCHITRNLFNALRQVWRVTPQQMLWADALCVNQGNDQEKALQVGLMGSIYKTATTVLIWLGEDKSDGSTAKLWKAIERNARGSSVKHEQLENTAELVDFLDHPWFTRSWTLQEVLLARKAVLMCGASCIDWRLFTETVSPLGPLEALKKCTEIMRQDSNRDTGNLFKELLFASIDRSATDSRDRIYSLLGILTQQNNTGIRADYTISSWELVQLLVLEQIRKHADVWFLHACGAREMRDLCRAQPWPLSSSIRPSWLPDILDPSLLRKASKRDAFSQDNRPSCSLIPNWSVGTLEKEKSRLLLPGLDVLRVQGYPIGICGQAPSQIHYREPAIVQLPPCISSTTSDPLGESINLRFYRRDNASDSGGSTQYLDEIMIKLPQWRGFGDIQEASRKFPKYLSSHRSQACTCFLTEDTSIGLESVILGEALYHDYYALGHAQEGDILCTLAETKTCFFLRPHPTIEPGFLLVGSAFENTNFAPSVHPTHKGQFDWQSFPFLLLFDLY